MRLSAINYQNENRTIRALANHRSRIDTAACTRNFCRNTVNDTFNDYHCGSSATSFVIKRKLNEIFQNVDTVPIRNIRKLKGETLSKSKFYDEKYIANFIDDNKEIVKKIKKVDWVVLNGEGCISVYNKDTCNMLYLIHLAKYKFNKHVAIINTSIYRKNYVQDLSKEEQNEYDDILKLIINEVDYCAVRDYYSLMNILPLNTEKVELSFDCLPLYVRDYYNNFDIKLDSDYILISGGNYLPEDYEDIINKIYQKTKKKMYFLYCDVENAQCKEELELFERLSKKIGKDIKLIKTSDIDEFISVIDNAKILISGRFHHTIAAFMVNTPFVSFKTNTKKIETILNMMDYTERLVDSTNAIDKVLELLAINNKDNNKNKQAEIIKLAENNFKFSDKE